MESSGDEFGLIDINESTELDEWERDVHSLVSSGEEPERLDFQIPEFIPWGETSETSAEDLGILDISAMDQWEEELELADIVTPPKAAGTRSEVSGQVTTPEERFHQASPEHGPVRGLDDTDLDIIDVFEQAETEGWEISESESDFLAEFPALGKGMGPQDLVGFETFVQDLEEEEVFSKLRESPVARQRTSSVVRRSPVATSPVKVAFDQSPERVELETEVEKMVAKLDEIDEEVEEMVELDWDKFPSLTGEGLLPKYATRHVADEELIDVELETELDAWEEREDLYAFEPQELELLERAGRPRSPVRAHDLPRGLLIPDLEPESSGVDEDRPEKAVEVFQSQWLPDPNLEMEMKELEHEYIDYMLDMEHADLENFNVLLDAYPDMPLSNWFPAAANHFRKMVKTKLAVLEEQMDSLKEVVPVDQCQVVKDMLESVLMDARRFGDRELDNAVQTASTIAQQEDLFGQLDVAKQAVVEHFNDVQAEFHVSYYTKFFDNFCRIISWTQTLMGQDLDDVKAAIEAVKTHKRRVKFVKEHLVPELWNTDPVMQRQQPDYWRTYQRKSVRTALTDRALTLLKFLELRLSVVNYETMNIKKLWLAMRRAHLRVTEIHYRATHETDNRVNDYLGFELNPVYPRMWDQDRSDSELSYEDDTEDYSEDEELYDQWLIGKEEAVEEKAAERKEEVEDLAIRFDYPPDIPLTQRTEEEPPEVLALKATPQKIDMFDLEELAFRTMEMYREIDGFHNRILTHFPYLNHILDPMLKMKAKLGAYAKDLIPKWTKAEERECKIRKEKRVPREVQEAAVRLEQELVVKYVLPVYAEACRMLFSLCDAMERDLQDAEENEIYKNRVVSDKVLPELLEDAVEAVKTARIFVHMATSKEKAVSVLLDQVWGKIVEAHRVVKTCLVMLVGKCDQTSMEQLLGYEVHKLSELNMQARDVLTFPQIAAREEKTEAAVAERTRKEEQEAERVDKREAMLKEEIDKENAAIEAAKESKNKLRIVVIRETAALRKRIRDMDEFVDELMQITGMSFFPPSLAAPMHFWRERAMGYVDGEAKNKIKKAYQRQIKKKDKFLLKDEQELLGTIQEQMQELAEEHSTHIVRFIVACRDQVKDQLPTVDTSDFDLHEAVVEMNTNVGYVEKYPWVARENFGPCWWAIEAAHKRLKELIFLDSEKFGRTYLEDFLGNTLVLGEEVALGLAPSEYVVEENLGVEATKPFPPTPPRPPALELIPKQPPKPLTAREKKEQERLAKQQEEERKKQEAEEAAKLRRKKRKRKLDPATEAALKAKAEAKAAKEAAEKEARRKAKEERDAKKAALEQARKEKHAKLTEQARKIRKVGESAAKTRAGEDEEEVARPSGSAKKKRVPIVDVNKLAKKIYDAKVKALSTVSHRPTQEELRRAEMQAMKEAEASITLEQRLAIEEDRLREREEDVKKAEAKAARAVRKAEEEKERKERVKLLKEKKAEEDKKKAEAAKEALKKRLSAERAAKGLKPIDEAAQRRREAAKMVSKPSASDRKPASKTKPKPKAKPEDLKKKEEEAEAARRAKREEVEKNIEKLKATEAFMKEKRRLKMLESDRGYPGLSSFGQNRSRTSTPPLVDSGCGHDHGDMGLRRHDSMLVLLKPTRSQFQFVGTEPHMYEPQPVGEREW